MNKYIAIGRLVRDAETRYSNNTAITRFTLAVDRKFKKEGQPEADFIRCVDFTSEDFWKNYGKKGVKLAIEGRIQTGSYTDRDNKTVYTTDVIIEGKEFAESKSASQNAQPRPQPRQNEWQDVADGLEDEGLPFN